MKTPKVSWKTRVAVLACFLLFSVWFYLPIAKVTAQEPGVHVFIAPLEVLTAKDTRSLNLPGGRVAGISCIPKPTEKLPDRAVCYIATSSQ